MTDPSTESRNSYIAGLPPGIVTPDRVETRLGTLEFWDGVPTRETASMLYDHLDFLRGVETFLNGIPAASMEAIRRGMASVGITSSNQVLLFDELMDSTPLFLTGNSSTVYASTFLDLKRDGPTVIEVPAGTGPGIVNDAFFRSVIDLGPPGPDRGRGGRVLILPPDYDGDVPPPGIAGGWLATAQSSTWINWMILRGFIIDGSPDPSAELYRNGLKIYPYADIDEAWLVDGRRGTPPEMEFISATGKNFNTIHSNDIGFYEELHAVIDREPVDALDPETRGLFAGVGVQQGAPFAPDERMTEILTDAVAVGNGTARSLLWHERDESNFLYEGSSWKLGYVGDDWQYLKDDGRGGRNYDARTHFFYNATVNSPAMAMHLLGAGSQYAWGYLDSAGNHLDGGETYRLNIPADVPALKFWSIAVYDPQSRSLLRTDQRFPTKASWHEPDPFVRNDDGSVDLYFGPSAPDGFDDNWIQTVPGKSWFCLLRLYSPLQAWYDKTWRPGDIEHIPS